MKDIPKIKNRTSCGPKIECKNLKDKLKTGTKQEIYPQEEENGKKPCNALENLRNAFSTRCL